MEHWTVKGIVLRALRNLSHFVFLNFIFIFYPETYEVTFETSTGLMPPFLLPSFRRRPFPTFRFSSDIYFLTLKNI